jgi:hypothetical protein
VWTDKDLEKLGRNVLRSVQAINYPTHRRKKKKRKNIRGHVTVLRLGIPVTLCYIYKL